MRLLIDKKAISDIFEKIGISYTVAEDILLGGYQFVHEHNGTFFIADAPGTSTDATIIEIDSHNLWKLDNFQNVFKYVRKASPLSANDCYTYYKRSSANSFSNVPAPDIQRYLSQNRQLNMCDIFLLIPGKLKKSDKSKYKAPTFADIKDDSYVDYIIGLGYINLFKGDEKGNFNSESTITRAEFATIVCRMLGYEEEANRHKGKSLYTDVSENHWASGYIYVASELGVISGYGDGRFGPEDPVKYEQAIKMLVCALGYNSKEIASDSGFNSDIPYPDGYMQAWCPYQIHTGNNNHRFYIRYCSYNCGRSA